MTDHVSTIDVMLSDCRWRGLDLCMSQDEIDSLHAILVEVRAARETIATLTRERDAVMAGHAVLFGAAESAVPKIKEAARAFFDALHEAGVTTRFDDSIPRADHEREVREAWDGINGKLARWHSMTVRKDEGVAARRVEPRPHRRSARRAGAGRHGDPQDQHGR